jgi:endonuclease/exonuclease/phosphatase (EEP) superfamily protein YafD
MAISITPSLSGAVQIAPVFALLCRYLVSVVLYLKVYRNAPSPHTHNVLAWNLATPEDFRAAERKNIFEYYTTTDFAGADVVTLKEGNDADPQLFTATDREGKNWRGSRLILAVGGDDLFPNIEGYADCWAKGT